MKLSIILVNYNTRELLRSCLSSIYRETDQIEFEVIVVDNGSQDGSLEMLAQEFPCVRAIANAENRGFAAANNQGAAQARGTYLLLLNSDTEILDRAIEKTVAFMDAHPEIAIAGCRLRNPDGSLQPSCRSFPSPWHLFVEATFLYRLFRRSPRFGAYHMSHFDHASSRPVDVVMGAFMMIRRPVFEKLGGFDRTYFMYTEETDFCYRARQAGFATWFFSDAEILHHVAASKTSSRAYFLQLHSSQILFIDKHFAGLQRWLCLLFKRKGLALRVPVYAVAGLLRADRLLLRKALDYAVVFRSSFRIPDRQRPHALLVNFSSRGGLAHHIFFLCQALAQHNRDFVLLTTQNFELADRCTGFRARFRLRSHSEYNAIALKALVYCWSLLILFREIHKLRPAVIHLQESRLPSLEARLLRAVKQRGCRIVFAVHDLVNTDRDAIRSSPALRRLYSLFDHVIVHTQANREFVQHALGVAFERITLLPVGEYTAISDGAIDRREARRLLGLAPEARVLLFFGYIRRYKGLGLLIEAFAHVKRELPDLFLVVAGEPKEPMAEYRRAVAAHGLQADVLFDAAYIPMSRMTHYFAAADAVVLPYLRVFQSGLVRLAYACRRPVIATRVGDLPEVVEDGVTGYLVEPNSVQALAGALRQALADPDRLVAMGEAGFRRTRQHFSWDEIARATAGIYEQLAVNQR